MLLAGSIQLVGLAILVFIQEDQIEDFRGFQIMKTKTAVSGTAGNKGALCARFEYVDPPPRPPTLLNHVFPGHHPSPSWAQLPPSCHCAVSST